MVSKVLATLSLVLLGALDGAHSFQKLPLHLRSSSNKRVSLRRDTPRHTRAAATIIRLRMSSYTHDPLDLFVKDCVEFRMPADMKAHYEASCVTHKTLTLGYVVDADCLKVVIQVCM